MTNFKAITVLLILGFIGLNDLYSQSIVPDSTTVEKKKKVFDLGFEGMIGAAVGEQFYSFNVGGPSFLFRITKDVKLGFGAFPSLYIKEGKVGAKLGVAPRFDYKHFVLFATFFHFENSNTWKWSAGLGYKFHRKNKS